MDRRSRPHPVGRYTRTASRLMLVLVGTLTLITTSCSEPVDFTQALDMVDVTTGWFDAGIVAGRNKIVPSVTLRFRNKTSTELERISVNALFRAADGRESELNNDVFVQRVEFQGNETPPITLRPDNGYTAEPPQSRADMLKHSQFRDMRVQVLVKQGSTQWTNMGWVDIERQLITR